MWRAVVVAALLISPASAEPGPYANPYNPYATSVSGGVQFRSYVSLDRLNLQYQSRTMPAYFATKEGTNWKRVAPVPKAALFRNYPNYPALNAALSGALGPGTTSAKSMRPLPLTAERPVETACDPYMDDNGCLDEYGGW